MDDDFLYLAKDARNRAVGIQGRECSTLVVGQPGSGKSKFLDAFILSVLSQDVRNLVLVCDPKETGFQAFKGFPRVRLYQDLGQFSNVFEGLMQEHQRRTAILADEGLEHIPPYMSRLYCVVDELPALVSDAAIVSKQASSSIKDNLVQLLRLARQTSVTLTCASQTSEGKAIVSASVRGMFSNRVLMKCANAASECEMLMNTSADDLRLDTMMPGEAWIKTSHFDLVKCWIDYYDNTELKRRLAALPVGEPDFSFMEKRHL